MLLGAGAKDEVKLVVLVIANEVVVDATGNIACVEVDGIDRPVAVKAAPDTCADADAWRATSQCRALRAPVPLWCKLVSKRGINVYSAEQHSSGVLSEKGYSCGTDKQQV